MPYTKLRFDLILSKADSGKRSPYSPQKKLGKECMVVVSKEVKVEPKSQPELAEEPPAPSEPNLNRSSPTQALGLRLALIIRELSS